MASPSQALCFRNDGTARSFRDRRIPMTTFVERYIDGSIDVSGDLGGELFEPLKDLALFKPFRVDTELNTISLETRADLAPEYLYEKTAESTGDR